MLCGPRGFLVNSFIKRQRCHRSAVGLLICYGVNSTPETPCVSAITEVMAESPGVLPLGLSHATGQVGPCFFQGLFVPNYKGRALDLQ